MSQPPFEANAEPSPPRSAAPRGDQVRSIMHSVRIIIRSIQDYSRLVESRCGLTSAQLWALRELFDSPGMKVSEVAAALYVHQSTASNMLDKLERKGLVERSRRGPDQRVVRLHLSEAGVARLATAPGPARGALNAALQRLPETTLQRLSGDLADLLAVLHFKDTEAAFNPLHED